LNLLNPSSNSSDKESSSSSSDSDSSSLESDSTSRAITEPKRKQRTRRKPRAASHSGSDSDDSESGAGGGSRVAPKTEHELEPEVQLPQVMKIDESAEIAKFGKVESVIETVVVVKADTAGDWRVLDEGTVVCWEDRTVIGTVCLLAAVSRGIHNQNSLLSPFLLFRSSKRLVQFNNLSIHYASLPILHPIQPSSLFRNPSSTLLHMLNSSSLEISEV